MAGLGMKKGYLFVSGPGEWCFMDQFAALFFGLF